MRGMAMLRIGAAVLAAATALPLPAQETEAEAAAPDEAAEVQTIPVNVAEEPTPARRDAVELDTIEVTSNKRVRAQRDLPGSVGAIRGEKLEQIRAQGMEDYLKLIPGVSLADYGTGQQIPVIRGIASSTGALGSQFTGLTTGIYLDDMPFSDLFIPLSVPDLNPFDLERVEVLKGPQGTLFGSGALAGAVRYIVRKPNLGVWQGKLATTVMQTKFSEGLNQVGAAAVNVPLFSDRAALRVVGLYREDAGFYDSQPNGGNTRDEQDINRLEQLTGRALARWDVTDELRVSGFYFSQDTDQDDEGSANQASRPERNDVPFASPRESSFSGGNFSATYDLPWVRLLYTGNLLDKETRIKSQQEPTLPNQLGNQQDTSWYNLIKGRVDGVTHELRVSSPEGGDASNWEWLAGAAYLNYRQHLFQFFPNPGAADQGYYANPPEEPGDVPESDQVSSFLWATVEGDGTEQALFGEVTRRLGEHWEATLGARWFETELIADTLLKGAQITALQPGQTESRNHYVAKERGFNPKLSMRYLHNRNVQAYVLAAKGFQFGGFQINPPLAGVDQAAEQRGFHFGPYKSSELWNYELGLRTEWLDRRVRFDVAAFYLDWKDLQLTIDVPINAVPIPAPPGSGIPENVGLGVIVNVGRAHSEGIEMAMEVLPFAGAKFTTSAAWISALTDEAFDEEDPDGPVQPGTRLPGTPRFQWANVFEYEHTLPYFDSWTGGFALTHAHIGSSPDSIRPVTTVGGYDTLDARVNLLHAGSTWIPEISAGVNNITDVRGVVAYSGDGDAVNAYYFVRPRTTLLTLAWKY